MTEEPHLLVSEVDNILIATFNRPDKLNAMSAELMRLLGDAVAQYRDRPELRVMLIRSQGRYFSSGADLKEGGGSAKGFPTTGSEIRESHRRLAMRSLWRRRTLRMPRAETVQMILGFLIPFMLALHVSKTRIAETGYGAHIDYSYELLQFWVRDPLAGLEQAALLVVASW